MEKPKDLIFILEEQLKFIKMTVTEREYLENTIDKLKTAINYTRCSTQLKGKETITFEEWKKLNCKEYGSRYYIYNDKAIWEEQLLKIYNEEILNL